MEYFQQMSRYWIASFISAASFFCLLDPAKAANQDDVRQLLQTNSCKGCDLKDAQLSNLDLTGANLSKTNLDGADLSATSLIRANLEGASLKRASISQTNFTGALLRGADLSGASNESRCLNPLLYGFPASSGESGAKTQRCLILSLYNMFGSKICSSEFGFSELKEGRDFCSISEFIAQTDSSAIQDPFTQFFQVTTFLGSDLTDALLNDVDLSISNFQYADLSGTSFKDSDLTYALMLNAKIDDENTEQYQSAFVTMADIQKEIQALVASEKVQDKRQKRNEAGTTIATVLSAQQLYHLEKEKFSTDLMPLGVVLSSSKFYRYEIVETGDRTKNIITGKSLMAGLPSFIGLITYEPTPDLANEFRYRKIICETIEPSTELPVIPSNLNVEKCLEGMKKFQ